MKLMALMTLLMAVCLAAFPAVFLREKGKDILSAENIPVLSEAGQKLLSQEALSLPDILSPKEDVLPEQKEETDISSQWSPFRILDRSTGEIREIPVREYVTGALCSEMPATFHTEALKAQAVSAHTWALYCQQDALAKGKDYDFSADPSHWQGYVTQEQARERFGDNFEEYWGRIQGAADAVWKKVVLDPERNPVAAAYHAISSGKTESAQNVWGNALPCLTAVESQGDIHAPGYQKSKEYTFSELKEKLTGEIPGAELSDDPSQWIIIEEYSPSGYVTLARVGGQPISGVNLRHILGLRSSHFDYTVEQDRAVFTVKGHGHGVGLSQYGADYMARQGSTYNDILTHYYQGCIVSDRK